MTFNPHSTDRPKNKARIQKQFQLLKLPVGISSSFRSHVPDNRLSCLALATFLFEFTCVSDIRQTHASEQRNRKQSASMSILIPLDLL